MGESIKGGRKKESKHASHVFHILHALYACMSCTLTCVICMGESIKEGRKKEKGFNQSINQESYVLNKKLIKRKLVIQLMYLVSQI